jgi:hypothetical protein
MRRLLLNFLIRLALVDVILLTPWCGVPALTRIAFAAANNIVFTSFGLERTLRFETFPPAPDALDTRVTVRNTRTSESAVYSISSRYFALMPLAFLIGLSLATPMRSKRRLAAMAWSLAALAALIEIRVWANVLATFGDGNYPGLFDLSAFQRGFVRQLDAALAAPLVGWFVMPLVIWLAFAAGGIQFRAPQEPATRKDET